MARPKVKSTICIIDGQEITPEWLVEYRGIKLNTAIHRIYEYNRGLIPAKTLMSHGPADKYKGKSNPTDEFRRLQDKEARPLRCPGPGTWESLHIPDREPAGRCRAGRPQGVREVPAYSHGQFTFSFR